MDSKRWQQIKSILDEALAQPKAERLGFVASVCAGDDQLRREVEAILASDTVSGEVLDHDAFTIVTNEKRDDFIGRNVGSFTIREKIADGGMGSVFLAERTDGEFSQKAAIKLIRSGFHSDVIRRRFLNERQILASLTHPNIAHLIDGGTTDEGLPYLTMEFVEGRNLIDYANEKQLGLTERLTLFREICEVVSFAHQNLVIHRDLKPSNILVDADGNIKLLDFGIAKLLRSEADGAATATQSFVFTPEYASPEQIKGQQLTTTSDVYSLGVTLYELLTGNRPFRTTGSNISDIIHAVCETEPERPSSVISDLGFRISDSIQTAKGVEATNPNGPGTNPKSKILNPKSLKGDLDNIILKALRKEPERRYSSVEQFSEDIGRHIDGLPVTASKDTWNYRAAKFVQRNKIAVAAAGVVLLTLIGGIGATLYQANVARRERANAEQRFNDVRQLANSFLFEFHDAIQSLSGSTPARKLVVSRAIEYLDKLAAESIDDVALQRDLATAYERIGKIQGNSYFSNLGDTEGAMKSYQRSLEIRQRLANKDDTDISLQYDLAISHRGVGDIYYTMDDLENGLKHYESAYTLLERVAAAEPDNLKFRSSLIDILSRLGDIKGMAGFSNLGDTAGALESYTRVVQLAEELAKADPANNAYQGDYATRLFYLGKLQTATGDRAAAIAGMRKSVTILESLVAANPDDAAFKSRLMTALNALRDPLLEEGFTAEATENARRVVKTMEQLTAADPQNGHLRRSLGVSYRSLGLCLMKTNNSREAIENFQRSIAIAQERIAAEPKSAEHTRDLELAKQSLSEAQSGRR